MAADGQGPGRPLQLDGTGTLLQDTVAFNTVSTDGGTVYNLTIGNFVSGVPGGPQSTASLTMYNSILANSTGGTNELVNNTDSTSITALTNPGVISTTKDLVASNADIGGGQTTSALPVNSGSAVVTPAAMLPGIVVSAQLLIDVGLPGAETVTVTGVTVNTFTAAFANSHSANFTIQTGFVNTTGFITSDPKFLTKSPAPNGGGTKTLAIDNTSAAFNAGDNNAPGLSPATLPWDERGGPGFPRVNFGTVDLGAFEVITSASLSLSGSPFMEAGGKATITVTLNGTASQNVVVSFNYTGSTAVKGTDYSVTGDANFDPTTDALIIPAGQTSESITLTGLNNPSFGTTAKTATVNIASAVDTSVGSPSSVTAKIEAPISLPAATLPSGTVGVSYSGHTFTAVGGAGTPYTFTVTAGSLPGGLSLSKAGVLSGKPTASGSFSFTVTATDSNGLKGSHGYSVKVSPAPVPTPATWLNSVYEHLLGRPVDPGGLAAWTGLLNSLGNTPAGRAQVVADIETSPEYLGGVVNYIYEQYLHRSDAGDPGAQHWINLLEGGATFEQVSAQVAGSPEFIRNFTNGSIGRLAECLLRGRPVPPGRFGWSGRLERSIRGRFNSGANRGGHFHGSGGTGRTGQ